MDLLLLGLVPGIPQAALRAIRERAAGIPLYAVETVRMLLDQGRLTETEGRFRLAADLGAMAVPDSLQALLGARLDALDDASRELVGWASVLGLSFSVGALVALGERPHDEVVRVLDGLVEREVLLLDDDPRSPERGQYRFIQGVLREVAYGRLTRRERLARHLAAARHFEAEGSDERAGRGRQPLSRRPPRRPRRRRPDGARDRRPCRAGRRRQPLGGDRRPRSAQPAISPMRSPWPTTPPSGPGCSSCGPRRSRPGPGRTRPSG